MKLFSLSVKEGKVQILLHHQAVCTFVSILFLENLGSVSKGFLSAVDMKMERQTRRKSVWDDCSPSPLRRVSKLSTMFSCSLKFSASNSVPLLPRRDISQDYLRRINECCAKISAIFFFSFVVFFLFNFFNLMTECFVNIKVIFEYFYLSKMK